MSEEQTTQDFMDKIFGWANKPDEPDDFLSAYKKKMRELNEKIKK